MSNLLLPALVLDKAVSRSSDPGAPKRRAVRRRHTKDNPQNYWPTIDTGLIWTLIEYVLPVLPPDQVIWEFAAGRGHLVRPLESAGRRVVASDAFPQHPDILLRDFLTGAPPLGCPIALSNPPWSTLTAFYARGLQLLDTHQISAFVLLMQPEHLHAAERAHAMNRATWEVHCCWRPRWVEGTTGTGNWSGVWVLWLPDVPRRASLYLRPSDLLGQLKLNSGETS